MEENMVMETENVDVIDDGMDTYDVVSANDLEGTSSNGAVYAIVGGVAVAAVTGAVLGGKKLIKKYKDKKLEKALKLVADQGYEVTEPEIENINDIVEELEPEIVPIDKETKKKK